jgi:hypothetical protein
LSLSSKILGWIFSDVSLGLILPCVFGVLIIIFPTILFDALEPIDIYFPAFLWGGPQIPLEWILTQGVAQGLLSCGIPVFIGLAWNRWAGGSSGFLLSVLWVVAAHGQFGVYFIPTVDWLGLIVAGMLAGYIAGSLMSRFRMQGKDTLIRLLIAAIIAAIVAVIFATATYVWYSPMFQPINGSVIDGVTYSYFINAAIYGVWAILGAIVAKVASWYIIR